jgi:8-oxo-dGTP pyrophosphatase MutT (NUDIX family)
MPVSSRDVLIKLDRRVPPELAANLEAARSGTRQPVTPAHPSPATSVVLLRERAGVLQTYVLHRHSRMPFAAGMVVFPGGRWDPVDGVPEGGLGLADPARLACGVRETLEETSVRLAPEDLHAWAHWITPDNEPRRYDTAFYLAQLPEGQDAVDISGEAWKAEWRTPAELLAAADHDQLGLMPPTRSILIELAGFPTVATALAATADRRVQTVLPRIVRGPDGWTFSYPGSDDPEAPCREPDDG